MERRRKQIPEPDRDRQSSSVTTWAIGDIQGCARSFDALLEAIAFDPCVDRLWLAGDLVNRGPDSLGVLRRVMALGDRAVVVLGNHDLHLLAVVAGVRPPWEGDTFEEILAAPDLDRLADWLRRQSLLHFDAAIGTVMVHAGLPPGWSLAQCLERAGEVTGALAGAGWRDALQVLYGNEPSVWSTGLAPADRRRYTINALTRMRFVDAAGRLDFQYNGPPGTQPGELRPWYDLCDAGDAHAGDAHVVFGHWASLGLFRKPGFTCIDTGCVWGRTLTALPVDPLGEPVAVGCVEERLP